MVVSPSVKTIGTTTWFAAGETVDSKLSIREKRSSDAAQRSDAQFLGGVGESASPLDVGITIGYPGEVKHPSVTKLVKPLNRIPTDCVVLRHHNRNMNFVKIAAELNDRETVGSQSIEIVGVFPTTWREDQPINLFGYERIAYFPLSRIVSLG